LSRNSDFNLIDPCSRVGHRIDVNIDTIVLWVVTIGYILALLGLSRISLKNGAKEEPGRYVGSESYILSL